jgi:hypothetical protein
VAGLLEPRSPSSGIADDPAVAAAGGVTPSMYNNGVRLTGGTNNQLVEVSNSAVSGVNCTSTPSASYLIFPLNTDPATLPIGGFTIAESGGVLTFYARRTDGTLVSMAMG